MATKTTKKTAAKKSSSAKGLKSEVKKSTAVKSKPEKKALKAPVKTKTSSKKAEADIAAPSIEKQEVISQYQVKEGDTGSPEVQVALLTKRVEKLVAHLKGNPADNHSRRGLLGIVSKRRRLLNYLEKKDTKRYKDIAGKLGLGK